MDFNTMLSIARQAAKARRDSAERIAAMQYIKNQQLKNIGANNLQRLVNKGGTDLQGLKNVGANNLQELVNTGIINKQKLANIGTARVANIRQTGNTLRHNTLSADEANRNKTLLKLSTLPDWQVMPASELTPPVLYNRRSTENPNMNTNDTVLDWLKSKQNQ